MSQRVIAEKTLVSTEQVDSVHGAKPEPEERPIFDTSLIDIEKQSMTDHVTGQTMEKAPVKSAVMTEISSVADALEVVGKYCQNCKYFNYQMGQMELQRIESFGTPAEKATIQELRVRVEMGSATDENDILVPVDQLFNSVSDQFLRQMGACAKLSRDFMSVMLFHPAQNGCPRSIPGVDGKPIEIPLFYEARDAEQARQDAQMRDMLLYTAAGRLK